MNNPKRITIKEADVFDILSAVWILASNDENEIITYEGIKNRLNLPANYKVKELIQSRGELFRKGVPASRLREWKEEMRTGRHLPAWIKDIDDLTEKRKAIEDLIPDDVFRSQFRAGKDSPQSPIEIINWGLEHIDRLRKANIDAREQSAKRWEIWLLFAIGILNIIVTVVVAFFMK
ncbi:MAG: hypothetical protein HFACDABA_01253 [Anaerolineales bacterium]|nr:hypothetical protein [Anaerolineales bacterium]